MIRVGTSGWLYPAWRGSFYPKGLPHRLELEYASRIFNSIEINGTFYSMKAPATFRRWRDETPGDFIFALKGARYITHMKKLAGVETALANFFAQGVLALGAKLGPILWQLPAWMPFDQGRVERFLELLPRDTDAAARLAQRRDRKIMRGRALLEPAADAPIRHALEVRHASFRDERFITLLRQTGLALVVSDAPKWPRFEEVTADFVYLRLHGAEELYASSYVGGALDFWAARVDRWAKGREPDDALRLGPPARTLPSRDAYVYFDNDAKVRAPPDALGLAERLGVAVNQFPPVDFGVSARIAARK